MFIKSSFKKNALKLMIFMSFVISAAINGVACATTPGADKESFWSSTKAGANIFSINIFQEDLKDAKDMGIKFIRLAPDKFSSKSRDFLIGNADNYTGLEMADLAELKKILEVFKQEKLPVVITMISLPGSRWKQLNNGKDDLRLWQDESYLEQAASFWHDLAKELKDFDIVVGYNILNEPHPERLFDKKSISNSNVQQDKVQQMLFKFHSKVAAAIRRVDTKTPIIVDSSFYADAQTFKGMKPIAEDKVMYSFHMYEPFEYTNKKLNGGKYEYPGHLHGKKWDSNAIKDYLTEVKNFQKQHKVASNRILVGEFGGHRSSKGLENYFKDIIEVFKSEGWHWAFYAYREDNWDGMDYELGEKGLPAGYWQHVENNNAPLPVKMRKKTKAFQVILDNLSAL